MDALEAVVEHLDIVYGLERRYNWDTKAWEYWLTARLPANRQTVEIKLELELGRTLAQYWAQNDAGTFLGRHPMAWVLDHLSKGEDI